MACEALHQLPLPALCSSCPPPHMPCAPAILSALQSKESPMPLECCSFCLGFPCLPGELVLQDCTQTAPPRRLPCHFPVLPRPMHIHPCWAVSYLGGVCAFIVDLLYYQTKFLQRQGLFYLCIPRCTLCPVHWGTRWMVCGRMGECGQRWV